jgi:hypothetical protein
MMGQIGFSDMVILNKVDLVAVEEWQKVRDWINGRLRRLRLIEAGQCDVPPEILLGGGCYDAQQLEHSLIGHHQEHETNHGHTFNTWSYETDRPLSLESLQEMIRRRLPGNIYRCTGLVFMAEVISISSGVQGVPPFLGRYTVDSHHIPSYAAGYLYNKVKPRLAMATHVFNDEYTNHETLAEVREDWKGPFHFGFDLVIVNLTKDKLWVREGIVPYRPNYKPPQFDLSSGYLHVPMPRNRREDIQEPIIREAQIPPEEYYPEGYHPKLLEEWPIDGDLQADLELLPEDFKDSVGENYNRKQRLQKAQEEGDD